TPPPDRRRAPRTAPSACPRGDRRAPATARGPSPGSAAAARRSPPDLQRADHLLGPHVAVELLLGEDAEVEGRLLEGEALLVGVLGDLRGAVVPDVGVERR